MNPEEKKALIDTFESLAHHFDDTVSLSEEMLLFRPFADAWSIKENIIHCLDFDVANFHRYRWAITYPGTEVLSFDQAWTEKLNYENTDLKQSIELMVMIRKLMADHLRNIVDQDWTGYFYSFANGQELNLEGALQHYINHVHFHRELIDRNIDAFRDG